MQDIDIVKKYANVWASDMQIKSLKRSEIVNIDVINQSIEMILATPPGSRLFNLPFGSLFSLRVFDNVSPAYLNRVLSDTVEAIELWEDRIFIDKDNVKLVVSPDTHTLKLTIPYTLKERDINGEFSKVIRQ